MSGTFKKFINNGDFADETKKIAVHETAIRFANQAVALAPVDTGRLRNDIHEEPANDGTNDYLVGTNVKYAAHQEFGTKHMAPQPFLRPAAYLMKNQNVTDKEFTKLLSSLGSKPI